MSTAPHSAASAPRPVAADPLGLLMLAFEGLQLPPAMTERLAAAPAAGITLFRYLNVATADQVRSLTSSIQAAAAAGGHLSDGPLLIAADQEGGQLLALGDVCTPFAGNMAIGATSDAHLAERVGRATGLELRALGVNVAYVPACDLATNPDNPGIGIRSFGSDPDAVARLAAALTRGIRSGGVAATAKHFPGLGEATSDSHLGLPVLGHDWARLEKMELRPFRAAVEAGADLVMSAHVGLPLVTGDPALPATMSRAVMHDLLRTELGFEGLVISDALDMAAMPQGDAQSRAVVDTIAAGIDLLLCSADEDARRRIEAALAGAVARGDLEPGTIAASRYRLARLRRWLAGQPVPSPEVVDSPEHRALARELAERSITLVRDDGGLLPLRLPTDARILAIMPRPEDLTPADTSSQVAPSLADSIRRRHGNVTELVVPLQPSAGDIDGARAAAAHHDLVVVGTIAAPLHPNQASLVEALLGTGIPTVTVALRTPFDLAAYPSAPGHVCTYGLLPASLDALADALFGVIGFRGRLPAPIQGIAAAGDGVVR